MSSARPFIIHLHHAPKTTTMPPWPPPFSMSLPGQLHVCTASAPPSPNGKRDRVGVRRHLSTAVSLARRVAVSLIESYYYRHYSVQYSNAILTYTVHTRYSTNIQYTVQYRYTYTVQCKNTIHATIRSHQHSTYNTYNTW